MYETNHVVCNYIDHEIHPTIMQGFSESLETVLCTVVMIQRVAIISIRKLLAASLSVARLTYPAANSHDTPLHHQYLVGLGP